MNELLNILFEAHCEAAKRDNESSTIFKRSSLASLDFTNAMCAAILSTGGLHAPISSARIVIEKYTEKEIISDLKAGFKIPGFGNSFIKGEIDSCFAEFDKYLNLKFSQLYDKIYFLSGIISKFKDKKILPNGSAYTACAAIILNVRSGAEPWLFVPGRVKAYSEMW